MNLKCILLQMPSNGLGSRARLGMECSRAKKSVYSRNSYLRHYNSIGAVGYGEVCLESTLPENEFFIPGKRFRMRLR